MGSGIGTGFTGSTWDFSQPIIISPLLHHRPSSTVGTVEPEDPPVSSAWTPSHPAANIRTNVFQVSDLGFPSGRFQSGLPTEFSVMFLSLPPPTPPSTFIINAADFFYNFRLKYYSYYLLIKVFVCRAASFHYIENGCVSPLNLMFSVWKNFCINGVSGNYVKKNSRHDQVYIV